MLKQKIKEFVLRVGIKNNFHKIPYWMIAVLVICFFLSIYLLYFNLSSYFDANSCESCSR